MLIKKLVERVNSLLDGEILSYTEMLPFLDRVIDDINQQLNSTYPAFSEIPAGVDDYDAFPDRYLRTVVAMGAAMYFYETDEEGGDAGNSYTKAYTENLFFMLRDWINQVPEQYQANDMLGVISDHDPYGVRTDDFNSEAFKL